MKVMNTIDSNGFLSPEIQRYLDVCHTIYARWFELVHAVNHLGQSLLGEVKIDSTDQQQSIAALLYSRVLGHAQGAVLLIERCMPTQGEVLCRASLEALFGFIAVAEKADTAELLVKADRYDQSSLLKAVLRRSESLNAHSQQQTTALLQEIKEDLERNPSSALNARDLAERAGQIALYDSLYKVLSLSVHSNLRDLEQQLSLDDDGIPTLIGWGPKLDGLDDLLLIVTQILLLAVSTMCRLFRLEHQEEIQLLDKQYTTLVASVVDAS